MQYQCKQCGMSVKGMKCGKCDALLVDGSVTTKEGKKVEVTKCPQGCGMIKSPQCCAHDMTCSK